MKTKSVFLPALIKMALCVSVLILCVAAFSKLFTLTTDYSFLDHKDPLLSLRYRQLLPIIAMGELMAAAIVIKSRRQWYKGLILAWIGLNFLAYRFSLVLTHQWSTCPCFGSVGASIGLSQKQSDTIGLWLAGFVVFSGVLLLFVSARTSDADSVRSEATVQNNITLRNKIRFFR